MASPIQVPTANPVFIARLKFNTLNQKSYTFLKAFSDTQRTDLCVVGASSFFSKKQPTFLRTNRIYLFAPKSWLYTVYYNLHPR